MAITTQTGLPDKLRAGDSAAFTVATNYDGDDGWRASIYLTSPDGTVRKRFDSATTSGTTFTFTLSTTDTAQLDKPGTWDYQLVVDDNDDGDRATVTDGLITVLENRATDAVSKSHARRCVEILEAKLEGRMVKDTESVDYLGVSVNQISMAELSRLLSQYRAELSAEIQRDRKRRGLGGRGFTTRVNLRG